MKKCVLVCLIALFVCCAAFGHAETETEPVDVMPLIGLHWGDSPDIVGRIIRSELEPDMNKSVKNETVYVLHVQEGLDLEFAFTVRQDGSEHLVSILYRYYNVDENVYPAVVAAITAEFGEHMGYSLEGDPRGCSWWYDYQHQYIIITESESTDGSGLRTVCVIFVGQADP